MYPQVSDLIFYAEDETNDRPYIMCEYAHAMGNSVGNLKEYWEAIEGYHKYDDKRGLYIIGAGTFGAPTREQVPGIPLQYNLLILDPENRTITVETRKKEKPDGAWSADARWGDKNNPVPRYTIQLR